jgi:hypothetical protein
VVVSKTHQNVPNDYVTHRTFLVGKDFYPEDSPNGALSLRSFGDDSRARRGKVGGDKFDEKAVWGKKARKVYLWWPVCRTLWTAYSTRVMLAMTTEVKWESSRVVTLLTAAVITIYMVVAIVTGKMGSEVPAALHQHQKPPVRALEISPPLPTQLGAEGFVLLPWSGT